MAVGPSVSRGPLIAVQGALRLKAEMLCSPSRRTYSCHPVHEARVSCHQPHPQPRWTLNPGAKSLTCSIQCWRHKINSRVRSLPNKGKGKCHCLVPLLGSNAAMCFRGVETINTIANLNLSLWFLGRRGQQSFQEKTGRQRRLRHLPPAKEIRQKSRRGWVTGRSAQTCLIPKG